MSGLRIKLGFDASDTDLTDIRWVQTIRTNRTLGGVESPYNDPQPPDDAKPFYWTEAENSSYINKEGFDAIFSDIPKRFNDVGDISWQAELSVVGRNAYGFYNVITTVSYGFQIKSGVLTLNPIQFNASPSWFQLNSFMNWMQMIPYLPNYK